jgi:hypothetical protein
MKKIPVICIAAIVLEKFDKSLMIFIFQKYNSINLVISTLYVNSHPWSVIYITFGYIFFAFTTAGNSNKVESIGK